MPVRLKTEQANLFGPVTSILDLNPGDPANIYASTLLIRFSGYTVIARNSLYRVNMEHGGTTLVQRGEESTARWITDGAGAIIARIDATPAHDDLVYTYTGSEFRKIATINSAEASIVGLTEDAKSLAVLARRENDRLALYRLDLADGKISDRLFYNSEHDVRDVLTDERTRRVIGVTFDDGVLKFFYFSPERQRLQQQIELVLPGQIARIVSTSADRSRILVRTSAPQRAPALQLVNLQSSRIDTLAEAYPQLRAMKLGNSTPHTYKSADGKTLTGLLTLPPEGEKKVFPLVVLSLGGFGYSDGNFDWFTQYLAQRGYAVFQAGARDLKDLGDVSSMDELGAWMNATQEDIASGVADLISKGVVDPKRVCIAGANSSGYIALSAPIFRPNRYACSVSFSGFSDIKVVVRNERGAASLAINRFSSSLTRNSREYSDEDLERFSPSRRASQIDVPILLLAGQRDYMMEQAKIMQSALTAAKKPVDLVAISGESGSLESGESRTALLTAVDRFLASHIGR